MRMEERWLLRRIWHRKVSSHGPQDGLVFGILFAGISHLVVEHQWEKCVSAFMRRILYIGYSLVESKLYLSAAEYSLPMTGIPRSNDKLDTCPTLLILTPGVTEAQQGKVVEAIEQLFIETVGDYISSLSKARLSEIPIGCLLTR